MSNHIPKVEESTKFNFFTSIWIVPIIALLIAGWLAFQYFSQLGPQIEITFDKNEGLVAGQSQIKYKDVPIGTVKKIELDEESDGVKVIARMDKTASSYLNEHTKFWIVKPEVGISGVSGLDTLISGTYINMYTEKEGTFKDTFNGLQQPYRLNKDGSYFILSAASGHNIKRGAPVSFKNIDVGEVEYVYMSLDGHNVDFIIFVKRPYVPYVHRDSKFWIKSAVNVDFSNGRLDVQVAPVASLIQGGVEFSSRGADSNDTVPDDFSFHLYENSNIAQGMNLGKGGKYVRNFEIETRQSLAKLTPNAPVQFEGYEVGRVTGVKLAYDNKRHAIMGNVRLKIDLSSFASKEQNVSICEENFSDAIEEGLHARFAATDFITGMLYVDLVFDDSNVSQPLAMGKKYPLIPTLEEGSSGLMDGVEQMIAKLNKLPLKKLIASLNQVVNDADKVVKGVDEPLTTVLSELKTTVNSLNKMTNKKSFVAMPDEVNKTLKELTQTLRTTKKTLKGYDNNSLITHQIAQTLKIVTKTSQEMQQFLKLLNRKPNSLIFGDK